jgi:hypothetical protein
VYIAEQKDEMTDKVYYYTSRQLLCVNPDDKKQGFAVTFFMDKKGDDVKTAELKVKVVGVGSCHEKDEIFFLLDGDVKVKGLMWNDFNCDGKAWFKISESDKELLAEKKLLKIRVQNGRSYESYTHIVEPDNQDYFIQLFYSVKNQKIKTIK